MITINARGIKSKLPSLKRILTELEPEIVALQETHLKEKEKIVVSGYQWIEIEGNRKNRSGRGVGFLIQNNIIKNVIREPTSQIPDKMELRWIRLPLANETSCY